MWRSTRFVPGLVVIVLLSTTSAEEPILIMPNDPVNDMEFGGSLEQHGNVLVVGAAGRDITGPAGAVYVFRNLGGVWTQEQKITAQNPAPGDRYGASVDVFDDVLAIGASGEVQVFRYGGSQWNLEQTLTHASLGSEVALQGDTLAARIPGGVLIYTKTPDGWVFQQQFTDGSGAGSDFQSLELSGERLIAGGGEDRVFVYRKAGANYEHERTLTVPGLPASASFGYTAALDGDDILVGAIDEDQHGAVYWFRHDGNSWIMAQRIQHFPMVSVGSEFGSSLAVREGIALIGAHLDHGDGTAWLYRKCDGEWVPEQRLAVAAPNSLSLFGRSAALSEDSAFVGASNFPLGFDDPGAVFFFPDSVDCDADQVFDGCSIAQGMVPDCDGNFVPDSCQSAADCNQNGEQDFCDLANQMSQDCNHNGSPDECDVDSGASSDDDGDGLPDECFVITCESPSIPPTIALVAVARNGIRVPPTTHTRIQHGDILDVEIIAKCWSPEMIDIWLYEIWVNLHDTGTPGSYGSILPVGWNAPFPLIPCPCSDPVYPVCTSWGCLGSDHQPTDGLFVNPLRPDYLLNGLSPLTAIDLVLLNRIRFGATTFSGKGAVDEGIGRYVGSIRLIASPQTCGTFEFRATSESEPGGTSFCTSSFLTDSADHDFCPAVETLVIDICVDDGLFCNGSELCDSKLGCQVTPPPSCDDGVACTLDACDESIDGCAHQPNHAACDDGEHCTRDECTPAGCIHVDDQCGDIPTTSHWGLGVLGLCLLITAKLRYRRLAA